MEATLLGLRELFPRLPKGSDYGDAWSDDGLFRYAGDQLSGISASEAVVFCKAVTNNPFCFNFELMCDVEVGSN